MSISKPDSPTPKKTLESCFGSTVRFALFLCLTGIQGDYYKNSEIREMPPEFHPHRIQPAKPFHIPKQEEPNMIMESPTDSSDDSGDVNCFETECQFT